MHDKPTQKKFLMAYPPHFTPNTLPELLRHSQAFNRSLLVNHLPCERVGRSPAQFHRFAGAGRDVLHADRLRDAVLLVRGEAAAGLGLEFEGVALIGKRRG